MKAARHPGKPLARLVPLCALACLLMNSFPEAAPAVPLLIPQPKHLRPLAARAPFRLTKQLTWVASGPVEARLESAVQELFHARLQVREGSPGPKVTVVEVGTPRNPPRISLSSGQWRRSEEGYRLWVSAEGARIESPSPRGAYWGLQSLAQLLGRSRSGKECPALLIEDWPALPFRGTHWFPSAAGIPFHRRVLTQVMPRYKLNATVIECEEARWDSHPEFAAPESIRKKALGELVETARGHFVEPIPLISIPGHAGWMFRNKQHLDLAEDPTTPYAYCVNHPGAEKLVEAVLTEAIDLFRPSRVHLGHDEVQLRGRFPNPECPRCRDQNAGDLLVAHARRWNTWLRKRGLRSMLWGDMFLAREEGGPDGHAGPLEEARRRRRALPKDILIADWHYGTVEYPSLALWQREGFSTLATTWHQPGNIRLYSGSAVAGSVPRTPNGPRCRGLLSSTWAGHFPTEAVLRGKEERQFVAWVLAAEYAWSGRKDAPSQLGYDPRTEFRRAYFGPPKR